MSVERTKTAREAGNRSVSPKHSKIDVGLLGGFRLTQDGAVVERPVRRRLQSLIALLVLQAGSPIPREQVGELLWPEGSTEQIFGSLRRLLFDLRHNLPELADLVQLDKIWISLPRDGGWISDVLLLQEPACEPRTIEQVRSAIELYRGDLLPSCYEDWIVPERDRLRAIFLDLLATAVSLAQSDRDYPAAIGHARRLMAEEPLQEEAYRTLMRLYVAAGDPAQALRTYHLCAGMLARELDVEPSPATREAYEALLQHEAPESAMTAAGRLIGRSREWDVLQRAWKTASRGQTRAVLLTGDPGIGKTRLLEEMHSWADRQGLPRAHARGYEAEGILAYGPVAALLRSAPFPRLDDVWLAELVRVLPEVASEHPNLPAPQPLTEAWQRNRLFEALARAVLARRPLLITLDDVQWIDEETLSWLHYLLRYAPRSRLLVVCAARPEGAPPAGDRARLWDSLRREGRLDEIDLAPLDQRQTHELATSAGAGFDHAAAHRLWKETEGNPLFVIESVRAGSVQAAHASIQAVLGARLAQLSAAAQHVAGAAALLGHAFTVPVLIAAAREVQDDLVGALDELWRYRIIREQGTDAYDFSHDRLRQAAHDAIPPATRQLLHHRIAGALEQVHAGDLDAVSAEIALHLDAAGDARRAAPFHVRAGDALRRVYANQAAASHYRRAVEFLAADQRAPVLVKLGPLLESLGELKEAEGVLRRALAESDASGANRTGAESRLALGIVLRAAGAHVDAIRQLEDARAMFAALGEQGPLSSTLSHLASIRVVQGDHATARPLYAEAERLAAEAGDRRAMLAAVSMLGALYFHEFDFIRAEEYLGRQISLADELNERRLKGTGLANLALVHEEQGRYLESLGELLEAAALFHDIGDTVLASTVLGNVGFVYRKIGDFARSRRALAVSVHVAHRAAASFALHVWLVHLGHLLAIQSRLVEAGRLLPPATDWLGEHHVPLQHCEALYFLADLLLRKEEIEDAAEAAAESLRVAEEIGRRDYAFVAHLLLRRLEVQLGRTSLETAAAQLEDLLGAQTDPQRRAAVHYTLWQLDQTREPDRWAAAELYRTIHPERPNHLYRQRYLELTGEQLPPPKDIPELPEWVREYPGTDEELLAMAIDPAEAGG